MTRRPSRAQQVTARLARLTVLVAAGYRCQLDGPHASVGDYAAHVVQHQGQPTAACGTCAARHAEHTQ